MATKEETQRVILKAAEHLFTRFGPIKTSVADIAREVGMSPANIYNFFPSRDAILEAVGEMNLGALREQILTQTGRLEEEWSKIGLVFLLTARHLRCHLTNEKDVLHIEGLAKKNDWKFIANFHLFLRARLENAIRAGIAKEQFRDMDVEAAASALFDCMMSAVDPLMVLKFECDDHERHIGAQLALLERAFQ